MKRNTFLKFMGLSGLSGLAAGFSPGLLSGLQKPYIKPPRLSKGNTIGLISPGFIIPERDRYGEIQETLQNLGFEIQVGKHALNRHGYFAGKDRERASDLNRMFRDPGIDAIIPFRGGWGSNRILQYIDFDAIGENPKPLIGFSDITTLLLSIYAKTGLVTFHGPVGKSEWTDFTYRHFRTAVMQCEGFSLQNPAVQPSIPIRTGRAEGPLLGGNLSVLTSMLGSEYLPDFEGAILFLEDVGEDVYRIDRMLTQLKLNGIFDQIGGLVFGQCTNCTPGNSYSFSLEEILDDHILPLNIPACRGAMIGHIDNMFTLPVGLPATLDAGSGMITFNEPAVG
ncbi:LD-carboxypeptidase [Halalkalibaculum sp. DA384]|uniref:S66 peptidase family protein n=1 Tax=Halalkalibaculum sp. DA384 TaxID=3373606 RepID=UPI00375520C9